MKVLQCAVVMAATILSAACASGVGEFREVAGAGPDPRLDPEEVVRIQVRALQLNNEDNRGIEVAFRFASPANKAATGPLPRFTQLFLNPAYAPMLNHAGADYGVLIVSGNQARQVVAVTTEAGSRIAYLFALSRQTRGDHQGSWMTDAVTVIGVTDRPAGELPRIQVPEAL